MSRTVKRIALVSPYDWAQNGGVTEHIRQLAAQLARRDIDATIIAPYSGDAQDQRNLISLGPAMSVRINGSIARPTLSPTVIEHVSQFLVRQQFDAIHLHEPLAPMLPLSVLNASTSANVGTFHASGGRSLGYATTRPLMRWLAQRLTVRIAVSPAAAAFVQRYVPGDYAIIPNGVDTERFRPDLAPWPDWNDGRPNVLFVGRFDEPRKGFNVLLEAWHDVEAVCPAARLLVVGRGDVEGLARRIAEQRLRNIVLVGPVSAENLPRWYRTATVFCAPSTGQESFGIILAEAMSSGVPVVASDIDGYRSVVQHRGEGLLVPPNQPAALAAALIHLLAQPMEQQAFAEAGRSTALRYAWSDVADRVVEVYERAMWLRRLSDQRSQVWVEQRRVAPALAAASHGPATIVQGRGGGDRPVSPNPQGEQPMLSKSFEAKVRVWTQQVVGRVLGRSGISPNVLTALGLLATTAVTLTLAQGYLRLGGLLVLVTSAFDMLDGALARATDRKSTFGAFLDSTVDRYAEALIFLGLLLFYQRQPDAQWATSLIYLTIVGSLMVSYTRAKAEALGYDCKVGLLGRPERIMLLAFGLFVVSWLPFALAVLAIFTNFTAAQRVFHVWQQDRQQTRPALPKPRRGWFVPRDQKPS